MAVTISRLECEPVDGSRKYFNYFKHDDRDLVTSGFTANGGNFNDATTCAHRSIGAIVLFPSATMLTVS
jgi:hypothetical protein